MTEVSPKNGQPTGEPTESESELAAGTVSEQLIADVARLRRRASILAAELSGLRARLQELDNDVSRHAPGDRGKQ